MSKSKVKNITPIEFARTIESLRSANSSTYLESIKDFCDERDLEVTDVVKLIDNSMKGKIEIECEQLNLIKGTTIRLPL